MKKVLIANRGEIVPRIMRTCAKMGLKTVAVYSDADAGAPYVAQADEACHIGPSNPMKSYLNIDAIMDAVRKTGADAVHPGYGFLSENAEFAKACMESGVTWIGPSPEMLVAVESKCYCRHVAAKAGVPVNPGTLDPISGPEEIVAFAEQHGYPVFLKLDKGGGGKGIEMVSGPEQASEVLERIRRVGKVAFHSSDCYIEKVLLSPRHIEMQFLGDTQGNYVCLGERECSIQRRHQKIIEESPSPVVTADERALLVDYTLRLAKAMGYYGAGTMEFLRSREGRYYFMEINARLQVEHPVSELITGIDIVEQQLRIAQGEPLPFTQDEVQLKGHAIEARVYAEDPDTFHPAPGTITDLFIPNGNANVRIDHALLKGGAVPPFYDPMLAKVIAWGESRAEAMDLLESACSALRIEGVKTTLPANIRILRSEPYRTGNFNTDFINTVFHEYQSPHV